VRRHGRALLIRRGAVSPATRALTGVLAACAVGSLSVAGSGSGTNATITGFPYSWDLSSQSVIDATKQVSTGAAIVYSASGGWNGANAALLYLSTIQGYTTLTRNTTFSGAAANPSRVNIRIVAKLSQEYLDDDTVAGGPKHLIVTRNTGNDGDRCIVQHHAFQGPPAYSGARWDIGIGNNINPLYGACPGGSGYGSCDSSNHPSGGYDFATYVSHFVCYEYELTIGGYFKIYITVPTGAPAASTWNERNLYAADPTNSTLAVAGSGAWDRIDVFGSFNSGAAVGYTPGGPNCMTVSHIVISNTYIGPPAGFRS
jgi:hypothetical protein